MAKQRLIDLVIPEIPAGDKVLKEGVMRAMQLYGKRYSFSYKYSLTEKGVWMRSPKVACIAARTSHIAYADLESFQITSYAKTDSCIFYPKKGRPGNMIFFDDFAGAIAVFDMFLPRKN